MKIDSKNNIYEIVRKNIKKYREMNNISLDDLSEWTNIDKKYLENLEDNKEDIIISIDELYKISVVLETNINNFFL